MKQFRVELEDARVQALNGIHAELCSAQQFAAFALGVAWGQLQTGGPR